MEIGKTAISFCYRDRKDDVFRFSEETSRETFIGLDLILELMESRAASGGCP